MKPETAVQIAYQETRSMDLFDNEWQGSGYLYAAVPNTMLKQQITLVVVCLRHTSYDHRQEKSPPFYWQPAHSSLA
jgi:hypothetical protein